MYRTINLEIRKYFHMLWPGGGNTDGVACRCQDNEAIIKYILSENFANNYNGKELLNVTYWCTAISYREVHCTPC